MKRSATSRLGRKLQF